jgi:hypothetical protein
MIDGGLTQGERAAVEKAASYFARNGAMFEVMLRTNKRDDPNFRWLFDDQSPGYLLYQRCIAASADGEPDSVEPPRPTPAPAPCFATPSRHDGPWPPHQRDISLPPPPPLSQPPPHMSELVPLEADSHRWQWVSAHPGSLAEDPDQIPAGLIPMLVRQHQQSQPHRPAFTPLPRALFAAPSPELASDDATRAAVDHFLHAEFARR